MQNSDLKQMLERLSTKTLHTCECAFYVVGECMGAFSCLTSIVIESLLGLTGLGLGVFFIRLDLVPDLVLGEVRNLLYWLCNYTKS
jgi:hypothetical protein